jgi:hypothetical protein
LSVLADAAFYAYDAEPRDPTRAVLTSAMAVELKVKETLSEGAEGQVRELVELLFKKPRDYSVAAVALFDEPLRIVRGRSLRTHNKELFKGVQTLFERRNDGVHRGKPVSENEADELVGTAFAAFRTLEAFEDDDKRPAI